MELFLFSYIQRERGEDITGVEIQEENCELALKNVKLNNLEEYIKIENDDVKEYPKGNTFDYIISTDLHGS